MHPLPPLRALTALPRPFRFVEPRELVELSRSGRVFVVRPFQDFARAARAECVADAPVVAFDVPVDALASDRWPRELQAVLVTSHATLVCT